MRVLFDQGTPVPLRVALAGHSVETAYERGWSTLGNGALLAAAEEANFEVLLTTDQSFPDQQNIAARRIAVIVLPTTDWREIRRHADMVVTALNASTAGACLRVSW